MRYVIEFIDKQETEKIICGLRLEIDYELVTLYDALQENDDEKVKAAKEKLKKLVRKFKAISIYNEGE